MFSLCLQNCPCSLFVEKTVTPSGRSEQLLPDLKFGFHIQNSCQSNEFAFVSQFKSLSFPFQSAYRSFHSTESTLLKIHIDIISSIDNGEVTALILLDLSGAFDTIDRSILISRLKNWFGFEDSCLSWFSSYLNSRKQAVSLKDTLSSFSTLSCGVPQGSVLLFTL
jgi:hypothetical protein